jgi:hypothetical protein
MLYQIKEESLWLWENAEFAQKVSEEKKPVLSAWVMVRHFAKLCVADSSTGRKIGKQVHKKFNIIPDT